MKLERDFPNTHSRWKLLLVGFLFGVLASFLALVVIACKWGPQGESIQEDMYSGRIIKYKFFLWTRSQVSVPMPPYAQWAIDHQDPVKSWYLFAASTGRGEWFGEMQSVDTKTRSHVYEIYSLPLPEEEKVDLLHQYHRDLDALILKEQERKDHFYFMESFHTTWDKTLKMIKNKPLEVTPTI